MENKFKETLDELEKTSTLFKTLRDGKTLIYISKKKYDIQELYDALALCHKKRMLNK